MDSLKSGLRDVLCLLYCNPSICTFTCICMSMWNLFCRNQNMNGVILCQCCLLSVLLLYLTLWQLTGADFKFNRLFLHRLLYLVWTTCANKKKLDYCNLFFPLSCSFNSTCDWFFFSCFCPWTHQPYNSAIIQVHYSFQQAGVGCLPFDGWRIVLGLADIKIELMKKILELGGAQILSKR